MYLQTLSMIFIIFIVPFFWKNLYCLPLMVCGIICIYKYDLAKVILTWQSYSSEAGSLKLAMTNSDGRPTSVNGKNYIF